MPSSLLSAAMNPRMLSCLSMLVWYTSTSLTHDFSSRLEKILTATLLPRHSPRLTSPNLPRPITSCRQICLATVRCNNSGRPEPDPLPFVLIHSCRVVDIVSQDLVSTSVYGRQHSGSMAPQQTAGREDLARKKRQPRARTNAAEDRVTMMR